MVVSRADECHERRDAIQQHKRFNCQYTYKRLRTHAQAQAQSKPPVASRMLPPKPPITYPHLTRTRACRVQVEYAWRASAFMLALLVGVLKPHQVGISRLIHPTDGQYSHLPPTHPMFICLTPLDYATVGFGLYVTIQQW